MQVSWSPMALCRSAAVDRRIDAAAQPEHDFLVADLSPDARASFFDERAHRPIHGAMADVKDKILQDLFAARRVGDFGMKLQADKVCVADPRSRRSRILPCVPTTRNPSGNAVTSSPWLFQTSSWSPSPSKSSDCVRNVQHARAILAAPAEFDLAAKMMRHQHQPVTNSQHRNA